MEIAFQTCDLCDAYKHVDRQLKLLPPIFRHFGGVGKFAGRIATVKCFEDNSLVKKAVESNGEGRVLVVDGGGSLRKALLGGNLAAAAARNNWAGVLIWGCVRDVAELRAEHVGILALASMPMPTEKRGEGQSGCSVEIAGVHVAEGEWFYADEDGVVISATPLHQQK